MRCGGALGGVLVVRSGLQRPGGERRADAAHRLMTALKNESLVSPAGVLGAAACDGVAFELHDLMARGC